MKDFFEQLREANNARQAEWPGNEKCDLLFRAIEVGGELGELLMTTNGYYDRQSTRDELGDAVIALDLLKDEIGGSALERIEADPSEGGLVERGFMMLEAVKKYYRAEFGIAGGHSEDPLDLVSERIGKVLDGVMRLASLYNINLENAVTNKFNKTSEKNGLQTRL